MPYRNVVLLFCLFCSGLSVGAAKLDLSFISAYKKMQATNGALQAARLKRQEKDYENKATIGLHLPKIGFTSRYTKMKDPIDIELNMLKSPFALMTPRQGYEPYYQAFMQSDIRLRVQNESFHNTAIDMSWPIFTGGKIYAASGAGTAKYEDSQEQFRYTKGALVTELVNRYYGVRLAGSVVEVRKGVFDAMKAHLRKAKKLEENGMISHTERLHAEVSFAEAEREYSKAKRNFSIAKTALKGTIGTKQDFKLTSKLFYFKKIKPMSFYIEHTHKDNPILKSLAAKIDLAHMGYIKERSGFLPTVYLFGKKELRTSDLTLLEPQSVYGIGMKINLFNGFSTTYNLLAARVREERVKTIRKKAKDDMITLVEKSYYLLKNAVEQIASINTSIKFAREYVRMKEKAFQEKLATSIDVVDARLLLSKAKIDRLKAIYDFDVALAKLLEISGSSDDFISYLSPQSKREMFYEEI